MSDSLPNDSSGGIVPVVIDPAPTNTVAHPDHDPSSGSLVESPCLENVATEGVVGSSDHSRSGRTAGKIRKLSFDQFNELFEDVLAEVNRREARRRTSWQLGSSNHIPGPARLLPNSNMHHRRNEARARLSNITTKRFHMLCVDALNEWKTRQLDNDESNLEHDRVQTADKADDKDAILMELFRLRKELRDDQRAESDAQQCMKWLMSEDLLGHPAGPVFQRHVGVGLETVRECLGLAEGEDIASLPSTASQRMPDSMAAEMAGIFRNKVAACTAIKEFQEARYDKIRVIEEKLKVIAPLEFDKICPVPEAQSAQSNVVDRANRQSRASSVDGSEWTLVDDVVSFSRTEAATP